MKQIAKNNYYELAYDENRNWIYWSMKGFWRNMSVVPEFDRDWDKIQSIVKKDFKIFADLSQLKPMPEEVKAAQDQRQQILMKAGCAKVACIIDDIVTKSTLNAALKRNDMQNIVRYFISIERGKAITFLNN
jgi:hypothetical protein